MSRGNPNIKDYSLISGSNLDLSEDENKNYISLITESYNAKKPNLENENDVNNAIQAYFDRCYKHNIKPGNMGIYNALGITRQEVNEYLTGRRKPPNCSFIDTLKKVKSVMGEYREILGSQGKLSPPVLIFWQKNHDNFEDVQRIDIDANTQPKAEKSSDQIKRELVDNLPIDSNYKEL